MYKCYLKNSKIKRIIDSNNVRINSLRYDETLPSMEYFNDSIHRQYWYMGGVLHRVTGPAIIFNNDNIFVRHEWIYYGYNYTFNEWLIKNDELSKIEKMLLKLKYN